MAVVGVAGMIGNVTSAGVEAGKNADGIRDQIKNIKSRTDDLQNQFNTIIKTAAKYKGEANNEIASSLDDIHTSHTRLKFMQEDFVKKRRNIQMTGVILVVSIFFLLLLKLIGVMDDINDWIMSPFQRKK